MGLSRRLAAHAVRGATVLLVEAPGCWQVRAGVERAVLERGWSLAMSPADADALVVCGRPGERLTAAVEAVWQQMPGPRARADVADADVVGALDGVEAALLDQDGQRADARMRQQEPSAHRDDSGDTGDTDTGDTDTGDTDTGDTDTGDTDTGDTDTGDMDMAPDGIDLAGGFDGDRDGLEMDVLHISLGPVLPAWPAGVVLRATLSGDVLVNAEVELLDDALPAVEGPGRVARADCDCGKPEVRASRGCDRAAALLGLAGAHDLAAGLLCVRDDLLASAAPQQVCPQLERLTRTVGRSRLLRWSLRGLGPLDAAALERHALPACLGGDVHDRLVATLEGAVDLLRRVGAPGSHAADAPGRGREDPGVAERVRDAGVAERVRDAGVAERVRDAVPALVAGYELAAARLVLASLPLEPITDHAPAAVR